jgi:hypothetical protein
MSIQERTRQRKRIITAHRARGFAEADRWDLEFWQRQTPEQRLSALVALRADHAAIHRKVKKLKSAAKK